MRVADEPLTKVTLNLYTKDIPELRKAFPNYTEGVRQIIRQWVKNRQREAGVE